MQCDYSFSFSSAQRQRFRDGELVREWRTRYPILFDEDDERVLRTAQQRRYHFLEWLSAVLLFESTGYCSLVEKYTAISHPHKLNRLRKCIPPNLESWLSQNQSGQPDLFVYSTDHNDWYFCEVKGPADKLRPNQLDWTHRLQEFLRSSDIPSKNRVRVLCLNEVDA